MSAGTTPFEATVSLKQRRVLLAALLTLIGYFGAQLLDYNYLSALPDSRIDVRQVFFSNNVSALPPEKKKYGDVIDLPYVWRENGHPEQEDAGSGWYTAVVNLNVPPNRLWVVYFPNISANSAIYLNNEILGRGAVLNERLGQMRQRPLYLNIPNGMLHTNENVLQIKIQAGGSFFGSIEPFYLGPERVFSDVYSKQYFYEITVIKLIGALLFFAALANGIIWILRKEETLYGWFALCCLLWSLHIISHFHIKSTWPVSYLEYLFRYISITWFTAILLVIVNRYQDFRSQRKERAVFIVAAIITVTLPMFPYHYIHLASNVLVGAFALSMIAYAYFSLLLNQTRRGSLSDFFIALSVAIIFFLSVNDLMSTLHLSDRKYSGMTAHYGAPFFVIVLGWKLIREFVGARRNAEELNRTLEARVEQKNRELEANFKRLHEMEKHDLLASERDRLIMDMHDGLGGQLVSAISMLDYDESKNNTVTVSETLKSALTDLRMMIDAMDPVCDDLAMVLGSFRQTLEKTLRGTNTRLIWKVQDVPPTDEFDPHSTLQILRILQEAVTNAIKYAKASEITISTGTGKDGKVYLTVADNGNGIPHSATNGRGLQNMKRRAEIINAKLEIVSNDTGVLLKLTL